MAKPSTPAVWASGKTFAFQPSQAQQAQGFDYIATVRPNTGAPITDDHDWPLNAVTSALKWLMDQVPDAGLKSAAFRDTGTVAGQVPLIDSFIGGATVASGHFKIPTTGGFIHVRFGKLTGLANSDTSANFATPFPSACVSVVTSCEYTPGSGNIGYAASVASVSGITVRASGSFSVYYVAVGY